MNTSIQTGYCLDALIAEVIAKYQKRLEGLEEEVKQVLKEEEEEKQVCKGGCVQWGYTIQVL